MAAGLTALGLVLIIIVVVFLLVLSWSICPTPLSLRTSVAVALVLTYPGSVLAQEVDESNVESRYFPVTLLILLPCRLLTLISVLDLTLII